MQTKAKDFYRPELDVLRFLAFILVFLDHSQFPSRSWFVTGVEHASATGLQIFFTLSAYLITELLLREEEKTGTVHVKSFFVRRVLRIWPLYLFFITLGYILAKLHHGDFYGHAYLAFLLVSGNWYVYLHYFPISIVGPLWSISVEEQFYLVWPFLFLWGSRKALRAAIPLLFAIAAAALWYSGAHQIPHFQFWSNSFIEFEFFALGAMLALVLHGRRFEMSTATRTIWFAGAISAYLLFALVWPVFDALHTGPARLIIGFGLINVVCACLLLGFYGMVLPRVFKPFIYLGRISYGLYVYHTAALLFVQYALKRFAVSEGAAWVLLLQHIVALLLTIFVAAVSYQYLELPFLRLKRRFTFVSSRGEGDVSTLLRGTPDSAHHDPKEVGLG